jgi:hypothetical protein
MRPAIAAVLLAAAPAAAQYPGYPGGYGGVPQQGFQPNIYNRQYQPLSPYLNLLRNGNPAVNYFYGVRPGLPSGGQPLQGTAYPQPVGPAAGGFLPQAAVPYDPNGPQFETGGQPVQLRPAGHPAFYGNQFAGHGSYQSVFVGSVNRGGFLPGGGGSAQGVPNAQQRAALGGLGATGRGTPPPRR